MTSQGSRLARDMLFIGPSIRFHRCDQSQLFLFSMYSFYSSYSSENSSRRKISAIWFNAG
jgi:hypothetical protein